MPAEEAQLVAASEGGQPLPVAVGMWLPTTSLRVESVNDDHAVRGHVYRTEPVAFARAVATFRYMRRLGRPVATNPLALYQPAGVVHP
ncbi:MAG: hypothetical protein ACYDAQ_18680 [Mycobacteriales bacterium]